MAVYCENCGSELTSLFCESCGTISSNIPNSFSTDDSLAGLLARVINQRKELLFSQVLSLTKSIDRTFRIFSQLEKTTNYLIIKLPNDFLIKSVTRQQADTKFMESIKTENKLALIKGMLELFPLTEAELKTIFLLQIPLEEFKKHLGSNYRVQKIKEEFVLLKK